MSVQEQPESWLRLTLTPPEAVDFGALTTLLETHLTRGSLTIRVNDEPAHRRIFQVRDLARQGLTAPQIADVLHLEDDESRGRERVAELKAAYGDLVRRLYLPTLPVVRIWYFQILIQWDEASICSLTAERKKGKYTYYRCTGFRGVCGNAYPRGAPR